MEGLLTILRAAHCRSTHHYFALDALRHIRTEPGRQLARMLLRYHPQYLAGAKDPDTRFRDFQNHVVHVADSHWGGAPRAAERWYGRLQQFLREQAWADAAHAAGILSHYFTDPLQPLHTGQSDREAVVHRPLEWSIYRSYNQIMARWRDDRFRVVFRLSSRPDWLSSAVLRGAELAHRSYETLVSTYDLSAAKRDPKLGLSEPALDSLAELFGVAIIGWSRILERTALEAEGHLPQVGLTSSVFKASLMMPKRWLLRRIENQQEQRAVNNLLTYYLAHGDLGPHLPPEVRLIHRVVQIRDAERAHAAMWQERKKLTANTTLDESRNSTTLRVVNSEGMGEESATSVTLASEVLSSPDTGTRPVRNSITLASPIGDAPSIGPKTAERFQAIGIKNIGQFLGSSPEQMVLKLRVRWIGTEEIADWQSQTRLIMALPTLKVRDAQILVGVGCRTAYLLETSDANDLCETILRYAKTPAGKRTLRGSQPPTIAELREWIEQSQASAASQAA